MNKDNLKNAINILQSKVGDEKPKSFDISNVDWTEMQDISITKKDIRFILSLLKELEIKDKNKKWRLEIHTNAIADTGDYDGCYEITDGNISIFTNDDLEDGKLEAIIDALNNSNSNFYLDEGDLPYYIASEKFYREEFSKLEKEHELLATKLYYDGNSVNVWRDKAIHYSKAIDDVNRKLVKLEKCIEILNSCLIEAPVDFMGTGTNWKAADNEYKDWYQKWQDALKLINA